LSNRLSQTVHFIEAVEQAKTATEIEDCLLRLARRFGLTGLFAGIVPTRPAPLAELRSRILFQRFPAPWIDRYSRKQYVFCDPIIQHLLHERAPFTWREGYERCSQRRNVGLIRGESTEFGLTDGYVVPVHTADGEIVSLSFGGPEIIPPFADLSVLNFAASYALGRHLHRLAAWQQVSKELTPREWDCLLWAGEGKTNWEISAILGISKSTVTKHIMAAREKLGAVSKAHAIATAIRTKLLR
jgi:LuxR family quorum sensing-dependent transcriptional regulator